MGDAKSILTSKTVWGALFVVGATVTQMLGINFGDATGWANDVAALFGAGFAIYGRAKAVKKITL